ncbi:MAG: hypothetical protein P4L31_02285 [Candidatus Babeliales bacterium]|nr:hypothetical protein [Candidatus Babeliales bacterium]
MNIIQVIFILAISTPGLSCAMENNEKQTSGNSNQSSSSSIQPAKKLEQTSKTLISDQSCPCCCPGLPRKYNSAFLLSLKPIKESDPQQPAELAAKTSSVIPANPTVQEDKK